MNTRNKKNHRKGKVHKTIPTASWCHQQAKHWDWKPNPISMWKALESRRRWTQQRGQTVALKSPSWDGAKWLNLRRAENPLSTNYNQMRETSNILLKSLIELYIPLPRNQSVWLEFPIPHLPLQPCITRMHCPEGKEKTAWKSLFSIFIDWNETQIFNGNAQLLL